MRGLRVAIIIIVLASLITMGYAQQANYAGASKIVLQIGSMVNGDSENGYSTYFNVHVLYSNDSAIKEGSDYKLVIYVYGLDYFGEGPVLPNQLTLGTVIGINDYSFDGTTITVNIDATYKETEAGTEWEQKITILSGGMVMDNLQLDPESLLSSSSIPSMSSIGTGNNIFNNLFTNSPTNNVVSQTSSTPVINTATANSLSSNMFSTGLNTFPSLGMSALNNNNGQASMNAGWYTPQQLDFANYW
ncbi:MAG: hypothetical protein HQK96_06585 [Nitrospirae bacterium]|nr:hypothetical protein [Nitrospirota bacterium]